MINCQIEKKKISVGMKGERIEILSELISGIPETVKGVLKGAEISKKAKKEIIEMIIEQLEKL